MNVKQLYIARFLNIAMLAFLACATTPLLAEKHKKEKPAKAKKTYTLLLDKVENIIWECSKEGYPDLAVSLSSAILNYPFTTLEESIRFLDIRSKMYLQCGDDQDHLLDQDLYRRKLLMLNKAS